MPISIVVEDGSNVENANAYVTVSDARTYAANRGVTLSAVDDEIAAFVIKASDYLESLASKYQGVETYFDQSLQWPRAGVYVNDNELPSNSIPKQLKAAQCALVIAQHQGIELQPNVVPSNYVVREKVGPLETEYADPTKVGVLPTMTSVDALLSPLFEPSSLFSSLRTIRV